MTNSALCKNVLKAFVIKCRKWKRLKIEQLSWWWILLGQYQVSKRDRQNSFATEPTIGNNANEVEWWHWVKNGDKHLQSVFLFTIFSKWDSSDFLCSQFIHLQLSVLANKKIEII